MRAVLAGLLCVASCAAARESFDERYPWVRQMLFGGEHVAPGPMRAPAERGAYAVGNGLVFAQVGFGDPPNQMTSVIGPVYDAPYLGRIRFAASRAGAPVRYRRQRIGWTASAAGVCAELDAGGHRLLTLDVAPEGADALLRIFVLRGGPGGDRDLELRFEPRAGWRGRLKTEEPGGTAFEEGSDVEARGEGAQVTAIQHGGGRRKDRWWTLAGSTEDWHADGAALVWRVPRLDEDEERIGVVAIAAAWDGPAARRRARDAAARWEALLESHRAGWERRLGTAAALETADGWANDFLRSQLFTIDAARSRSGGYAAVIYYTYVWIRDSNGPIRFLLSLGLSEPARGAQEYFYRVAAKLGVLPSSVTSGRDVPVPSAAPTGFRVEHAEAPTWIVLQHLWDLRTTGDTDWLRPRWPYLVRCMEGQERLKGELIFQRDEPYLWDPSTRAFPGMTAVPQTWMVPRVAYSSEALALWSAGAAALAEIGEAVGRTDEARRWRNEAEAARRLLDKTYLLPGGYLAPARSLHGPLLPAPHGCIALVPMWAGLEDPASAAAMLKALPPLWDGRALWLTPTIGHNSGLSPAMLLRNLALLHHPWMEQAWSAVREIPTPSGDFAEIVSPELDPWSVPQVGLPGASGRVRPWEGGVAAHAVLESLAGCRPDARSGRVTLAPHLPPGQSWMRARRLPAGAARLEVELRDEPGEAGSRRRVCRVVCGGAGPVEVNLELALPASGLLAMRENGADAPGHLAPPVVDGGWPHLAARRRLSPGDAWLVEAAYTPGAFAPPPARREPFVPPSAAVAPRGVVLVSSPWSIFRAGRGRAPADALAARDAEATPLRKAAGGLLVLDGDFPLLPGDLDRSLFNRRGERVAGVLVLGRRVLERDAGTQKTTAFWAQPLLGSVIGKFVRDGGALVVLDTDTAEAAPDWLRKLAGGTWTRRVATGRVVPAGGDFGTQVESTDEVDFGVEQSERDHKVTIARRRLPPLLLAEMRGQGMRSDDGSLFTGSVEFLVKIRPGATNRLRLRHDHMTRPRLVVEASRAGGGWTPLGTVKSLPRPVVPTWREGDHVLPGTGPGDTRRWMRIRVRAEGGGTFRLYHGWVETVSAAERHPLFAAAGWTAATDFGAVDAGLTGTGALVPILCAGEPAGPAVLLAARAGEGAIFRSTLGPDRLRRLINALAADPSRATVLASLKRDRAGGWFGW